MPGPVPSSTIGFALRGDTLARWTSFNPILADRELVLERDTNKFKIGDGVTAYLSLPYGGIVGPAAPAAPQYESALLAVSPAASFTLTHGLGGRPYLVQAWLVCVTASEGWSVDDWYGPIGAETFTDGANNGIAIVMNATQVKVKFGSSGAPILSATGTSGITYANWRLVVRAWR